MLLAALAFFLFLALFLIRGRLSKWLYSVTDLPLFDPTPGSSKVDFSQTLGAVGFLGCALAGLMFVEGIREL